MSCDNKQKIALYQGSTHSRSQVAVETRFCAKETNIFCVQSTNLATCQPSGA
jgi:hypothetical protein